MKLNNNDDSHNSGLNLLIYNMLLDIESHPAWVCGLKLKIRWIPYTLRCHTLRGCVDWNGKEAKWIKTLEKVTPCVGVWIETLRWMKMCRARQKVTPCVGVWIETWPHPVGHVFPIVTPCVGVWIETHLSLPLWLFGQSHTLRGCVDWNMLIKLWRNVEWSHTLRGCVDWNPTW